MIGQTISHYRILEQIGAGGMGVVYRAHDERLDRDVALKVLSPELAGDREFLARFRREARTLSKLNHPNIATVHDFDTDAGTSFIVMELVRGTSLIDKIRTGPIPEPELLRLATQLLDGLSAAHAEGIIHRDLKPGNLRLTLDGRLKILDFGLAHTVQSDLNITQSVASTTGVVGTLPYMAPEQLRGEIADVRTDIYSAGVVLYELATGSRPFPDTFAPRLTDSILHRIPISAREINAQVSRELDAVILTALEKEPRRRYHSAQEMLTAIDHLHEGTTANQLATRLPTPPEIVQEPNLQQPKTFLQSQKKVWIAASGVVLAALVALALWTLRDRFPGTKNLRPTIAVLGFKNQTTNPETDWVSTSLSDMLSSELAAGDFVVPTPAESVARAKLDLALPGDASYSPETIQRIRRSLRCDYVVHGAFFDPGKSAGGRVQLDLRLYNAKSGEVVASVSESGSEVALPDLAARVGVALRGKLGAPGISRSQSAELQAAVPSTPEATRLYFQGLGQLRNFDLLGAQDSLTNATKEDPNFSLAHAYLAETWRALGFDEKAKMEAKSAFVLSSHLGREDKTLVEARFREISSDWDKAVDLYRSLWTLYPENPEYAIRAADVQIRAGQPNEALKTIELLRKQSEAGGPDTGKDPRLDLKEAEAAEALSDYSKEKQSALRAADGARAKGSRLLEAEALWRACAAMAFLGDAPGAQTVCQRSIELAKPVGDLLLVARCFTILGLVAGNQGDPKQSLEQHQQALEFARKIGSRRDITGALTNIGNVLANQDDLSGAQKKYQDALAVAQEIGDRGQIITLLNNLATVSQSFGKFPVALHLYQQSLEQARSIQDKGSAARAQHNIGFIYSLQGDLPSALQNFQQAAQGAEETGNKSDQAQILYALGDTKLDQGDLAAAEENYQSGLQLANSIGDKSTIAMGRLSLGRLRLQQAKAAEALVLAQQAAEEFKAQGFKDQECDARNLAASALLDLDRRSDASKEIDFIAQLSPQDPTVKLAAAITAARLQLRSGQVDTGKKSLDSVRSEATRLGIPGLQFEARLAQGEIGLFGGDKRSALFSLSALQKDAAKKGFRQIEARAKSISRQISGEPI
jgi:serine/threonine protein kinase/tetratricopeptide (TPR) repeat protein